MRCIIIDDEPHARKLIREYLQAYPEIAIIAECQNGNEAIQVIPALQPDLIFLDIQMPGKDGLAVLQTLDTIPFVIFSTAYDQYAIQAFEHSAVDYLLKPYSKSRFDKAMQKLLQQLPQPQSGVQQLRESMEPQPFPDKLLVIQGNKLIGLPVNEIIWIEADGDYTRLHSVKQFFLSNKSMQELSLKLSPHQFIRIHRSAIVSIQHIKAVEKELNGWFLLLDNEKRLKVSRSYQEKLRELIL